MVFKIRNPAGRPEDRMKQYAEEESLRNQDIKDR